jgi:hypothetical protein
MVAQSAPEISLGLGEGLEIPRNLCAENGIEITEACGSVNEDLFPLRLSGREL